MGSAETPDVEGIVDSYVLINRDNLIYESKNTQNENLKAISESLVNESWKDELGLIAENMKLMAENLKVKQLKSLYRIKVNDNV